MESAPTIDLEDAYEMYFGSPIFEPEKTQSTCRLGEKWNERLEVGDMIQLLPTKGNAPSDADVGLVTGLAYQRFDELPAAWLEMEHDPTCRTHSGLAEEMDSIYGDDFHRQAMCTMVLFVPHVLD